MHMNQAILVGVVGSAIELREAKGEAATCSFTIGTEVGGEPIAWHRVRAWGYRARRCARLFRTGDMARIIGPLTYTRPGGRAEVRALEIELLSRGASHGRGENAVPNPKGKAP